MSDDLKKHIQLVESQLNENPLSTAMRAAARLGQGSKKTARIMPDPEDDIIPSSRALTPATELPPGIDAEIAQRITVLKAVKNLKDRRQILTQLDQAEGLLRAIDQLPEDMVRDALKSTGISINEVRMLAKRMTRIKAQVQDAKSMNRRVWREAVKDAGEIKAAAQKAANATDVEAVSVVVRNTVAIAAAAGLMGFVAAAALEQRDDVEEDAQLDENPLALAARLLGRGAKQKAKARKADELKQFRRDMEYMPQLEKPQSSRRKDDILDLDNMPRLEKPQAEPIDPNIKPSKKGKAALTKEPGDMGDYYKANYQPHELSVFTGKPLNALETVMQKAFRVAFVFVPASVFGVTTGMTASDVVIAIQEPTDNDRESVKRMRAYIKEGFGNQAAWLADLTGEQINALKDFVRTGNYQPVDEEELTQRMEALRARLEAE